jgi:hypothetical protein
MKKNTPEPRPADAEPAWREQGEGRFNWSEPEGAGLASPPAASSAASLAAAPPTAAEPAPAEPAFGPAAQERTDFWSKAVASVPPDLQRAAATPRADEPASARASWPAAAESATESAGGGSAAGTGTAVPVSGLAGAAEVSGTAQAHSPVRSAAQATVSDRDDHRKDRLFPVRLLVVIVIAALIGSALVLLLK